MKRDKHILLKVCGMRDASNIKELVSSGPDFIGLIFYDKSKRFVGETFDVNRLQSIPSTIKKVGVFVNASLDYVKEKVARYQLNLVQLHGDETPGFCKALRKENVQVIKVFSVGSSFDFSQLLPYGECVDYFLFDTKGKERGGNGVTFNWKILADYSMKIPFFLSGGLGPESIEELSQFSHEECIALDINSGFESAPGMKKIGDIQQFKSQLNNLETQ